MSTLNSHITQLYSIRTRYGKQVASKKIQLLLAIANNADKLRGKKVFQLYYDALLFIIVYPDNKTIYELANESLRQLQSHIQSKEQVQASLYNTGITGSAVCAAYSFEMVKWLRKTRPKDIKLSSFEVGDAQIQSILSVVMPKVESEILQDANAEWRGWLKRSKKKEEDLLDQFIAIFDSTTIRPEVKDELWNAIGINTEIKFSTHCCLPGHMITPYYHRSLKRQNIKEETAFKATRVQLTETEAEQVLDCCRMILVRHLREIDSISFSAPGLVEYYRLPRGLSIALTYMVAERRHPNDSYLGYVVFKNGLPVAYAGSWIMFDSSRIGLNVFPSYRGGESQYIFQQALQLHSTVYRLKRFSVDPYQVGKENSDGIHSGSFWVYYHAGFRPLLKVQQELAQQEAYKIKTMPGYRSPATALKKLADCRLQLIMNKNAVLFDATDLSLLWSRILRKKYNSDRKLAEADSAKKLASILKIKNYGEEKMKFILENWSLLLLSDEEELRSNKPLKTSLKRLFALKAYGPEEDYIRELQKNTSLKKLLEKGMKEFKVAFPESFNI